MIASAISIWAQTIFALILLGLAGGWALWFYRDENRPFLWMAAPMAGIGFLSCAFSFLYFKVGLSVPVALCLCMFILGTPTLILLGKSIRQWRSLVDWKFCTFAIVTVITWSVYVNNGSAILMGEPTWKMRDGTDAIGYSQFADWTIDHPSETPTFDPSRPYEAYIHGLFSGDTRVGAFLLLAATSWVRDTSAIFSYDFWTSVAFATGVLGLAGTFANRRGTMFFLLITVFLSLWMTISRTGYLGKILAYPGYFLLAYILISTAKRFSIPKILIAMFLSYGIGLCHDPLSMVVLLGIMSIGVILSSIARFLIGINQRNYIIEWKDECKNILKYMFIYVLMVGPYLAYTAHSNPSRSFHGWDLEKIFALLRTTSLCHPDLDWCWILASSLGLESSSVQFFDSYTKIILIVLALSLNLVFIVLAIRANRPAGIGFLLCSFIPLLAWWLDIRSLAQVLGLFFPLSVIGSILVIQEFRSKPASRFVNGACIVLVLGMIALRVPQFENSFRRYVLVPRNSLFIFKQSDIDTLTKTIGNETVDIAVQDLYSGLLLQTELGRRNIDVQYREHAWNTVLPYTHWPVPSYDGEPKFLITTWATTDKKCRQFNLLERRNSVAVVCVQTPYGIVMSDDSDKFKFFWQDNSPSKITLLNGSDFDRKVAIIAECQPGPSNQNSRTLIYTFSGNTRRKILDRAGGGWKLRIALDVPPGEHILELSVEDCADTTLHPNDSRELLLLVENLRLDDLSIVGTSSNPKKTNLR